MVSRRSSGRSPTQSVLRPRYGHCLPDRLGGPGFARAYDYSERTGDQGIMGSAELRVDLLRLTPLLERFQLYAFGDGGTVESLRGGPGGGSLASGGGGLRLGRGAVDAGVDVAVPFTNARFDTGDHSARMSGQVALHC